MKELKELKEGVEKLKKKLESGEITTLNTLIKRIEKMEKRIKTLEDWVSSTIQGFHKRLKKLEMTKTTSKTMEDIMEYILGSLIVSYKELREKFPALNNIFYLRVFERAKEKYDIHEIKFYRKKFYFSCTPEEFEKIKSFFDELKETGKAEYPNSQRVREIIMAIFRETDPKGVYRTDKFVSFPNIRRRKLKMRIK